MNIVSVIIPTYNRSKLLKEAIRSVVNQTYRPIECIVIDDGSTDNTKDVVLELLQHNTDNFQLKYFYQSNLGSQAARNRGIDEAIGEYFQFLDSDDLLYPKKIENQVDYLKIHPECDCVFGDWNSGTKDNFIHNKAYKGHDFLKQIITMECPLHTLSFLMRRSLVIKTGYWDISIRRMQEIDYQLTALINGGKFAYQEQLCGLWRYHNDQRIQNTSDLNEVLDFYYKWERILSKKKLFSIYIQKKIAAWYMWLVLTHIGKDNKILISLMKEAVRLDNTIAFYKNLKLRIIIFFFGKNIAFTLWLNKFRNK